MAAREATLKAMREISSNESSARILLEAGILPPLVKGLFSVGAGPPADAAKGGGGGDPGKPGVVVVIELCGGRAEYAGVGGAPRPPWPTWCPPSGAPAPTISLIQFVEAAHREIRLESLKLLRNVSPYMGAELADALGLGGSTGQLGTLLSIAAASGGSSFVTEEQAAALGLLGDLPERDWNLTRQLLDLGAFRALASKLAELRRGTIRGNRHVAPFTEGAVKVLYRVTCALQPHQEDDYVEFAREAGLAPLFVELLLQQHEQQRPGRGAALLGHGAGEHVASVQEAHGPRRRARRRGRSGRALWIGDAVDNATEGVLVLGEADGLCPVVDVLVANRTEALQRRAVWAVERILRVDDIALEVAADQTVASALVEAYRNGDGRTRQTAERALRHLDRLPNFSSAFHSSTATKGQQQ
ncbi:hypothetical protein PR202_gb10164 [Eleusine coracana subsp. coracana]|uniref:Uncharacterized protein n=1 Tax=Eleusine coracana subsp. coracana TaxID=191504 RepID=A0AAV5EHD6_ELECO|nr:hypothetical protein PR202_gb10164 [Eleusine coracana subsp. coracana]